MRQLCSKSNNRCDERAATDRKPRPGQVWTAVATAAAATAATEQRLTAQNSRRQTPQQPKLVFKSCLLATRPWAATLIDMPKDLAYHHAGGHKRITEHRRSSRRYRTAPRRAAKFCDECGARQPGDSHANRSRDHTAGFQMNKGSLWLP